MAFWRLETSRLSLASAYNRPRSHGEYAIAKKFRRYFLEIRFFRIFNFTA
jgi:hypothetical protein